MSPDKQLVGTNTEEYKEKVSGVLQQLKNFIKDIDDDEIKTTVSQFLKSISDAYMFVIMGEVKAGKSSFINALLGDNICAVSSVPCTNIIHEIRYGEEAAEIMVDDMYKRQFTKNELVKNISVVDTPGTNSLVEGHQVLAEKFIPASDLLVVILPATNPHNDSVWELLKEVKNTWNKKVIFVLQQKDLMSTDNIQKSIANVRRYAVELGFPDPLIFAVSAEEEINGFVDTSGYEHLRNYVKQTITDTNSLQLKQKSNLATLQQILQNTRNSFDRRCQQYEVDIQIVKNINHTFDSFRETHDKNVQSLVDNLMIKIDSAIEDYRLEIIRRLDPYTIKERFQTKADFELWLSTVNENYKNILNKSVERKTQHAMKTYLVEMADVLERACKYLEDREVLLDFEDILYGTLAQSKKSIVSETQSTINQLTIYNKSLTEASEDLFMGIWEARRKFDQKRNITTGVVGTIGVAAIVAKVATAAVFNPLTLPVVLGIIGTIEISKLAYKLSASLYAPNMEKEVNRCVDLFNNDINNAKNNIKVQIADGITQMFEYELKSMERNFLDFRTTTYIDDDKIPRLKALLELIEKSARELFHTMEG